MAEFHLKIALGNDAMQTGRDIAAALRKQAQKIEHHFPDTEIGRVTAQHTINDDNGNRVGFWKIKR